MFLSFNFIIYFSIIGLSISAALSRKSPFKKRSMSHQKLKILCLHGLGQNNSTFSNKTGSMRKRVRTLAELTYIDAPFVVQNLTLSHLKDLALTGEERTWFHPNDDRYSDKVVTGFNESIPYVENVLKTRGPFDGVLGFSQGAELLGLICCLKSKNLFLGDFKFAIFVSGFKSHCPAYKDFYSLPSPIDIPSLHIWGKADQIIVKERSEDLMKLFNPLKCHKIEHPGGHFLPGHATVAQEVKKFLLAQQPTSINNDIDV